MMAPFIQWIPKDVEDRILEAAETIMLCPPARGPQQHGNAMPEPVRRLFQDAAPTRTKVKILPEAAAIDRMEETWEWINELAEEDRKIIYNWSYIKVRRRRYVKQVIAALGYSDRTFYRRLRRILADITENLNKNHAVQLTMAQNEPILRANHISSPEACSPFRQRLDGRRRAAADGSVLLGNWG